MQQSVLRGSQNKFYETRRAGKSLQSFLFFSFIQLLGYEVVVICFKKVLFHNANSHCIQVDFSLISSLNTFPPISMNSLQRFLLPLFSLSRETGSSLIMKWYLMKIKTRTNPENVDAWMQDRNIVQTQSNSWPASWPGSWPVYAGIIEFCLKTMV